jgi:hypothetical protein
VAYEVFPMTPRYPRPGPHTVGEVAKDLGRSLGAVGNALAILVG